jgi:anti-sigma factor RsiW
VRLLDRGLVCREAIGLVSEYLEGTLTRRQRRRLEAHLAKCPNCSQYLEQIRTTIATSGRIEPDALSPEARADLVELWRRFHEG